jgi:predicted transcriptional regulator
MADRDELLALAAQVVSAYLANNAVATGDVPKLIGEVYHAITKAEHAPATVASAEPSVSVKKSVTPGHLVCLECGKHFSMLKRHLATDHQLTAEQYRQKWNLPASYPIVAPEYAKVRSRLAKKIGLGRLPGNPGRKGRRAAR